MPPFQKDDLCRSCIGWEWECPSAGMGLVKLRGTGEYNVLLVGEAAGEDESLAGYGFVGKAGFTLDKLCKRGGVDLDKFWIYNTIACRPPQNKLAGMWYFQQVIDHCAPHLDQVITDTKPKCILALGKTAFQRLLPEVYAQKGVGLLDSKKTKGVIGYTFWSDKYQTWVMVAPHPSFVLRGQTAWAQSIIFCLQRAIEIARDGYSYETGDYTLDCTPADAHRWVDEFERYYIEHSDLFLSCDIETPEKDADESELDLEDRTDYIITRCGYSYRDMHGMSIPWDGPYRTVHQRLLSGPWNKCWWNGGYDQPRIIAQDIEIGGASHDGMDAWHILNSDLKKSLNFVTPWFLKRQKMWKHLSGAEPAYYNAVDAMAAGANLRGIIKLLKQNNMYKVYQEFILELDPVYAAMTRAGMPINKEKRIESARLLTGRRKEVLGRLNLLVPDAIKPLSPKGGYKKTPKDTTGLTEVVFNGILNKYCSECGIPNPKKSHFKSKLKGFCSECGVKWTVSHVKPTKKGKVNPCAGVGTSVEREQNPCVCGVVTEKLEGETRWARIGKFVPSTKGILTYQTYRKHPIIYVGKQGDKKPTTDEKAIKKLIGRHPDDNLYPSVLEFRELQTLITRYIGAYEEVLGNPYHPQIVGGFPVGRDGRVHGVFRHSPSTLRSSMVSPNLQNIPRGDDSDIQKLVKQMFVAEPGMVFVKRDFSGIEAQLVGVEAGDKDFLRLAKIDIHSYFTGHNLIRQGVLTHDDEPSLGWSDADLKAYGKMIKKRFDAERNIGKRCIHAGDYRVGPKKLQEEYPHWFPKVKDAAEVLSFFYEVFPSINQWHERLCRQVDRSAVVINAFGHTHRFYQVLNWEKRGADWIWSYSDDSKRLIAFNPQSNAALIGKRALKKCYYDYPESVGRWLRLFIHDEIFGMCPKERQDEMDSILQFEMEKEIPEIRLDPTWGFGDYLRIESEGKAGPSWDDMH